MLRKMNEREEKKRDKSSRVNGGVQKWKNKKRNKICRIQKKLDKRVLSVSAHQFSSVREAL